MKNGLVDKWKKAADANNAWELWIARGKVTLHNQERDGTRLKIKKHVIKPKAIVWVKPFVDLKNGSNRYLLRDMVDCDGFLLSVAKGDFETAFRRFA